MGLIGGGKIHALVWFGEFGKIFVKFMVKEGTSAVAAIGGIALWRKYLFLDAVGPLAIGISKWAGAGDINSDGFWFRILQVQLTGVLDSTWAGLDYDSQQERIPMGRSATLRYSEYPLREQHVFSGNSKTK